MTEPLDRLGYRQTAQHRFEDASVQITVFAYASDGMSGPVYDQEKLSGFLGFFMEGYEREHHLAPEWLERLNLFIAYRRILMLIVMNDWVQSDPALHTSWKQMILPQPDVVGNFQLQDR